MNGQQKGIYLLIFNNLFVFFFCYIVTTSFTMTFLLLFVGKASSVTVQTSTRFKIKKRSNFDFGFCGFFFSQVHFVLSHIFIKSTD